MRLKRRPSAYQPAIPRLNRFSADEYVLAQFDDPPLPHLRCRPFCRKVRLVLAEKRIEVELVEDRYWGTRFRTDAPQPRRQAAGPAHGRRLLAESQAICEYLDETPPVPADARQPSTATRCAGFAPGSTTSSTPRRRRCVERVWKRSCGRATGSRTVKAGAGRHPPPYGLYAQPAGTPPLAGWRCDDAGRFHRRRASVLP